MISQYFTNSTPLVVIINRLRCGFAQFKLCAHFLDLRGLLVETRSDSLQSLLLLRHCGFQFSDCRFLLLNLGVLFLHLMVFFEKLVEQHRVHRVVAHCFWLTFGISRHQIGRSTKGSEPSIDTRFDLLRSELLRLEDRNVPYDLVSPEEIRLILGQQ